MATMVDRLSLKQRIERLDTLIAAAEKVSIWRTRVAMESPFDDAPDSLAAVNAMWADMDLLAILRVERINLILGPTR